MNNVPRWPLRRIGDLFDIQLGKMLSPKARGGDSPRPYLRNADVQWGRINTSNPARMDFDEREAAKFELASGDILVCEGGEPGRAAIWLGELAPCYYQKALHRLRPRDGGILPEFYVAWARVAFREHGEHDFRDAKTTIAHLPAVKLAELPMPCPPLNEQRAIAAILSKIQKAVDIETRIVATLKDLKAATMARLFCEGLRGEPLKQTEIGEIPESWRVQKLGECVTLQRGIDLPVQSRRPGQIPVMGSNGPVGQHDSTEIHGPGVIVGRSGSVGATRFVLGDYWPLNTVLYVRDFHGNDVSFVYYFLDFLDLSRFGTGVSVPTLNRNVVHEERVALPGISEQREITERLRAIDRATDNESSKLAILVELFESTLAQLMSEALRIPQSLVRSLEAKA